jgi:hypothetical protein
MIKHFEELNKGEVVNAYIMFRSMEGAARALKAYKIGKCKRSCCSCLLPKKKSFMGKRWLKVKTANPPGIIMWENLNTSGISRFFRILLVSLITIILVAGTFYITILEKN